MCFSAKIGAWWWTSMETTLIGSMYGIFTSISLWMWPFLAYTNVGKQKLRSHGSYGTETTTLSLGSVRLAALATRRRVARMCCGGPAKSWWWPVEKDKKRWVWSVYISHIIFLHVWHIWSYYIILWYIIFLKITVSCIRYSWRFHDI